MADKEERILIQKIEGTCKFRELHETTAGGHTWIDFMCGKTSIKNLECDDNCFNKCEWKELIGISRSEVIERMAKAIFKRDSVLALDIGFENLIEQKQNVYRDFAEIALNALLEDKK